MNANEKRGEILNSLEKNENLIQSIELINGEVYLMVFRPINLKFSVIQDYMKTDYCFRRIYQVKCNVEYFEIFMLEDTELETVSFKFYYEDLV